MKIKEHGIYKTYSVLVSSIFCNLFGGFDVLLNSLFILSAVDIITGILSMIFMKSVSSKILFQFFAKKICVYCIVAVSVSIDSVLNTGSSMRGACIGFFIGTEALAVLENCNLVGLPLPSKLLDVLSDFNKNNNK
nr:MAG TPA: holin [Caudoviricetes sp.]